MNRHRIEALDEMARAVLALAALIAREKREAQGRQIHCQRRRGTLAGDQDQVGWTRRDGPY